MRQTVTTGSILGCILAGGRSRRMGRDKAFVALDGEPLAARAIRRLRPQVGRLAVSFNGDPTALAAYGLPVLHDTIDGFQGPLAGILAALEFARGVDGATHVATVAADTPFFPEALVATLIRTAARDDAPVLAASAERIHPVFGLFPVDLADDLGNWMRAGENRAVRAWTDRHRAAVATFPFEGPHDPFFNINTAADLDAARNRLAETTRSGKSG